MFWSVEKQVWEALWTLLGVVLRAQKPIMGWPIESPSFWHINTKKFMKEYVKSGVLDNLSENIHLNEWTIGSQTSERMDIQQTNKWQMSKKESSEWLNTNKQSRREI